jgi:hypothetical protein
MTICVLWTSHFQPPWPRNASLESAGSTSSRIGQWKEVKTANRRGLPLRLQLERRILQCTNLVCPLRCQARLVLTRPSQKSIVICFDSNQQNTKQQNRCNFGWHVCVVIWVRHSVGSQGTERSNAFRISATAAWKSLNRKGLITAKLCVPPAAMDTACQSFVSSSSHGFSGAVKSRTAGDVTSS